MALDFQEIVLLIFANGLVDTLLGLAIGIAVVAKIAARKSKENLVTFLTGDESEALWAKQASRVVKAMQPQIDDRMGRMEALIRTEMPHSDATIADMKRDLESKFTELDRGITAALLDRLQNEGVGPATTRFLKKTGNWKPGLGK